MLQLDLQRIPMIAGNILLVILGASVRTLSAWVCSSWT